MHLSTLERAAVRRLIDFAEMVINPKYHKQPCFSPREPEDKQQIAQLLLMVRAIITNIMTGNVSKMKESEANMRSFLASPLKGRFKVAVLDKFITALNYVHSAGNAFALDHNPIFDFHVDETVKIPYVLVTHGEHFAVYDRKYHLLRESASPELIAWANTNNTKSKIGFTFTSPEQQPSWITEELKPHCVTQHLWDDRTPEGKVQRVPLA